PVRVRKRPSKRNSCAGRPLARGQPLPQRMDHRMGAQRTTGRVWRACIALAMALFAAAPIAFAQGADGGAIGTFPITGAYSATFREDRNDVSIIEMAGN